MDFLAKPTVLAAIQSPSFRSIYIATDAAYAQKITVHLCRRRQQQLAPRQSEDHLGGREVAQHTPLVASPPTCWSTATAHHRCPRYILSLDPSYVPPHSVAIADIAIVPIEQ